VTKIEESLDSIHVDTDLFDQVARLVSNYLGIPLEEIKPESSFLNDLGADSLDTVELVMAFEEEFRIEILDEESEKIKTIQDAIDLIKKKQTS
jgi:acyl carrier protein